MGGIFETRQKARVQFKLPEFSHNKTITWNVHVDEHTALADAQYDMIIGTDLMEELWIKSIIMDIILNGMTSLF